MTFTIICLLGIHIQGLPRFTSLKDSKALTIFEQFKSLIELQRSSKIKEAQTDWGGEFCPFNQLLKKFGIHHRFIFPHTHHQNGVVERKHRRNVEMGLTLLS